LKNSQTPLFIYIAIIKLSAVAQGHSVGPVRQNHESLPEKI